MSKTLSVIVPVYGTQRYIERCARSLLEQDFENVEFIFVNDASPDSSMDILRCVIADYPNRKIRILENRENLGLALTRFVGIDVAEGEYIYNCDSDDWIEPGMLSAMMRKAEDEDADMVCCSIMSEFANHSEPRSYSTGTDYEDIHNGLLAIKIGEAEVSLCNKIIRKSLLTDNNIRPYPGINMGEDSAITVRLRYFSRKTILIPHCYYHYNITNTESLTYRPKKENLKQLEVLARNIETFFNEQGCVDRFRHLINWYKFSAKREYVRLYHDFRSFKSIFPEADKDILRFNFLTKKGRIKWRILSLLPKFIFPVCQ